MRMIRLAAIAALPLLVGCAGEPASTPSTSAEPRAELTEQESQFLAELGAIDVDLTTKPDRELRRARNVCLDIEQGKAEETVVDNTRQRYTNDTTVILDADQARRIVDAAREKLC